MQYANTVPETSMHLNTPITDDRARAYDYRNFSNCLKFNQSIITA